MTGFLIALLFAGEVIEGSVIFDRQPLPGCTVKLSSPTESRVTVSDAHGRYGFRYVPAGTYELSVELAGLETSTQQIDVRGHTVVPAVELRPGPAQVVTITCTLGITCMDAVPRSPWDLPLCIEQTLNTTLIEAAEHGDRSALARLQRRYETADTYREKHRIAAALLGRVPDDRAMWNELREHAAITVRFPRVDGHYSSDFEAYCRDRNLNPDQVWATSVEARKLLEIAERAVATEPR